MARLGISLAVLALVASASGKKTKTKTVRQTCVDQMGQAKVEGQVWQEGTNGCLVLTCTNGVAVGTDNCACTYPDGTSGHTGDRWYSIPTCQTCTCTQGAMACEALLNCVLPTSTAVTTASATGLVTSCTSIAGITMNIGDSFIEDCQTCSCTVYGLTCTGMAVCPTIVSTITGGVNQCFLGQLSFIDSFVAQSYVPNGYVYTGTCNSCTCSDGVFQCQDTCGVNSNAGYTDSLVTVTVTPDETDTSDYYDDVVDDENAANDCDVNDGIVLDGDSYTNDCGALCECRNGAMSCGDCLDADVSANNDTDIIDDADVAGQGTSEYVCIDTNGGEVENGNSYMANDCTNCTCVNGVFSCAQVCDRECKDSKGTIYAHGESKTSTCQKCTCKDATLTCENTCPGQVCTIPNSKTTIQPGKSKTVDSCLWCRCTSTVLLQCRDKCPTSTSCVCDGRTLKDGKTRTTGCKKCTCNNGDVTCVNTC